MKPVVYSSYPDHYHGTWLKSNNEFTVKNYSTEKFQQQMRPYSYASGKWKKKKTLILDPFHFLFDIFVEDSQGNINPYAVTGCVLNSSDDLDHGTFWKDNKQTHCLLDPISK